MNRPATVPFEALPGFNRFYQEYAAGRLPAALRTAGRPEDEDAWSRRMDRRRQPSLDEALGQALIFEHRRLGAGEASMAALAELAGGRAWAVMTGQQPGLFGGPLYTRYKIATTVALARWLTETQGIPAVPVYWNATDDADFDEVAHASLPARDLAPARFSLAATARSSRRWIGDIPVDAIRGALDSAAPLLAAWPDGERLSRELAGLEARDFGDWTSAILLEWFRDDGLIVVDARLPELRRAAAPLFAGYLGRAGEVRAEILVQGEEMRRAGFEPPLGEESAAAALFITPERERLKLSPEEALAEARRLVETHPGHLSPNVVLRPMVVEAVFPALAQVVGPAEVVYLSQLGPAFDLLGVPRPLLVDRLSLTMAPGELLEAVSGDEAALAAWLSTPGEALRHSLEKEIPAGVAADLAAARASIETVLARLSESTREVDASLPQLVDSARDKVLFQVERIAEGITRKLKNRREQARPGLKAIPDFLCPRRRPQERELASVSLDLLWGDRAGERLAGLAAAHRDSLMSGRRRHFVVEL